MLTRFRAEKWRSNAVFVLFLLAIAFRWPPPRGIITESEGLRSGIARAEEGSARPASHAQEAERELRRDALRRERLATQAAHFRSAQLSAPFWQVGEGFESILMINNTQPRLIDILPFHLHEEVKSPTSTEKSDFTASDLSKRGH